MTIEDKKSIYQVKKDEAKEDLRVNEKIIADLFIEIDEHLKVQENIKQKIQYYENAIKLEDNR